MTYSLLIIGSSDISIVLALTLLALMLPDTRYRADPDKIICFTKVRVTYRDMTLHVEILKGS